MKAFLTKLTNKLQRHVIVDLHGDDFMDLDSDVDHHVVREPNKQDSLVTLDLDTELAINKKEIGAY